MKFKIDEHLPMEVVELLQQVGHDAATVLQQDLGGRDDADIASRCRQEERVLITLDTDFADIRSYPPAQYFGLIVLRLRQQNKPHVLEILARVIPALSSELLTQHLWIVEEDRIRIRG